MPNKRELQQIAFNHSTDFGFKNFMNLYTKCTAKPYFFLDIDANLVPDNSSSFKKNLLKRIWKLIMAINDTIRDEKWQYDFNREIAKKFPLSPDKIDKHGYLIVREILPNSQKIMM